MRCNVNDVEVYYDVIGEGIPVIILHGSTLDSRSMTGCMEPIFEQRTGWKRIYIDFPGHGQTPGKDWIKGSDDLDIFVEAIPFWESRLYVRNVYVNLSAYRHLYGTAGQD